MPLPKRDMHPNELNPGREYRMSAAAQVIGQTRLGQAERDDSSSRRRVVYAGTVGSIVEYYDFGVYGYAATTLAAQFFPSSSALSSLLAALAVFAVAFLIRPLGSAAFGHIGDRYGRKPALSLAIILMAVATFGIGMLPTFATVGVAAPILLVVLRLMQGLSAGGELSGAAAMLSEAAPDDRRGFMSSAVQFGSVAGLLLASGVIGLTNLLMTPEQFSDWGWRVAFFLGLPTGLIGLYIRNRLDDTTAFQEVAERGEVASLPSVAVFRIAPRSMMKAIGLSGLSLAGYYIIFIYLTIYLQTVGRLSRQEATWSTVIALAVAAIALPLFGLLSDKVGRKPVLLSAALAYMVFTVPLFGMLQQTTFAVAATAQITLALFQAAIMGTLWAALTELFPTKVRYTGIGLGFNIAGSLVGGTAPYIATWLVQKTDDNASPAYFLVAVAVVALITLLSVQESADRPMPD